MALDLIFMGTPAFAVSMLEALLAAGHHVVCVYTQPPRPAGRGHRPTPSPVGAFATSHGIPMRTPATLKDLAEYQAFAAFKADAAVVAAYGLILPATMLAGTRLGCFNVHASLLPRWRGAAPIAHAILAGDHETGISIMQMDAGLDTGPVLATRKFAIEPGIDAGMLHDVLAKAGAALLVETLAKVEAGTIKAVPQAETGATYATKITKDEARIDWRHDAAIIARRIHAFTPLPGAWFECGGVRIKALKAAVIPGEPPQTPGTVLDDRLTVACGAGRLQLLTLQRPGKAPLAAAEFLRGFPLPRGTLLG